MCDLCKITRPITKFLPNTSKKKRDLEKIICRHCPQCGKCKKYKPLTDYAIRRKAVKGSMTEHNSNCEACVKKKAKWEQENRPNTATESRKARVEEVNDADDCSGDDNSDNGDGLSETPCPGGRKNGPLLLLSGLSPMGDSYLPPS